MKQVSKQQLTEWIESPVTLEFKKTCQSRLDDVVDDSGLNAYHLNDAAKTQETLAILSGQGSVWQEIIETLDGEGLWELEELEELENEE